MLKSKDWVGRKFGRLTVTALERFPGAGTLIVCQCTCGKVVRCKNHNLLSGGTGSCGCLWKEKITTHGMTKTRAYVTWKAMKNRCYVPSRHSYKDYGGRGIRVCARWLESFENFLADMGQPPEGQTLDRINNDGHYTPKNCRWATYEVQLNNTSSNRRITAFGKTQSLTQWAREYQMPVTTLRNRILRGGMRPEDALSAPLFHKSLYVKK